MSPPTEYVPPLITTVPPFAHTAHQEPMPAVPALTTPLPSNVRVPLVTTNTSPADSIVMPSILRVISDVTVIGARRTIVVPASLASYASANVA